MWNSRLQHTGDFETLAEALAAIDAAYPEATQIRCYEYTVDDEFPREAALLVNRRQMAAQSAAGHYVLRAAFC